MGLLGRWTIWLLVVAVWTLLLLTARPVEVGHEILADWTHLIASKTLHFLGYAGISALAAWLKITRPRHWLMVGFLFGHAVTTEYLQNFVPLRSPSLRDVCINVTGIVVGLALTREAWLNAPRNLAPRTFLN